MTRTHHEHARSAETVRAEEIVFAWIRSDACGTGLKMMLGRQSVQPLIEEIAKALAPADGSPQGEKPLASRSKTDSAVTAEPAGALSQSQSGDAQTLPRKQGEKG